MVGSFSEEPTLRWRVKADHLSTATIRRLRTNDLLVIVHLLVFADNPFLPYHFHDVPAIMLNPHATCTSTTTCC